MIILGEHKPRVHDVMISFLPLAHMLERACENSVFYVGGCVGYYSGDIKELTNDLKVNVAIDNFSGENFLLNLKFYFQITFSNK